jgi:type II secretory pathway component PulF
MFAGRLTYPALLMAFVLALVGFICTLALKASENLINTMQDFGIDQPTMSRALTAMARFVTENGLAFLGVVAAMATVGLLVVRFGIGAARRRRFLCGLPVVGKVLRYVSLTEFCHRLAMLVEAETPLPLAFELAGASVRDADVAEACARMGRAVEAGEPLSTAMSRWDSIPAGLSQLFRWSEDRRNLPEALHLAGEMFEARARSQASYASHVINALMFLLILWWVGFAVSALYMPLISMITLITRLSG